MSARVTILAGPPGVGKTERLLARYRARLAAGPIGSGLWLAPTHRSAADVRRRLLDGTTTAILAPRVTTFAQFAVRVVESAHRAAQPLSPLAKRELWRSLIQEAAAEGKLRHFQPVAHTTGLIDVVARFVGELKRQEIWPDQFESACARPGATAKDRELAWLYRRYQDVLLQHQLYDEEGRFWSARTLLREGHTATLDGVRLVVADGFADFTWAQHDILEILAGRVEELAIALPLSEDHARRGDLFDKPADTLAQLQRRHPQLEVTWLDDNRSPNASSMRALERRLFEDPRQSTPEPTCEGVELIEASEPLGEVRRIAARVKTLLLEGDPQSAAAVEPDDVVIVYRTLAEAAPLVREVFGEFGIPVAVALAPPLREAPVLKALAAVLRLHRQDWEFRDVLTVIGQRLVRPVKLGAGLTSARLAAEQWVRQLQLPSGREPLLQRLQSQVVAARDAPGGDDEEDALASGHVSWRLSTRAAPLLLALDAALRSLPAQANARAWASALEQLVHDLGIVSPPHSSDLPEADVDRAAWKQFSKALSTWEQVVHWSGGTARPLTFGELCDLVDAILDTEPLPRLDSEAGCVRVLSATQARTVAAPFVFVAGLSEQAFPLRSRDDPLYDQSQRWELSEAGVRLPQRRQQSCGEMLLFYELATRATRRLFLSYPATNDKAESLLPSPYLLDVRRIFGDALPVDRVVNLSPIPVDPTPLCVADLRVRAVHDALGGDPRWMAALRSGRSTSPVAENLRRALSATAARGQREAFGAFEGMLTGKAARGALAEAYGPRRVWSASQLEEYAACPFRFFVQHVLGIEPPDEIALEEDRLQRGQWLHELLAKAHQAVAACGDGCSASLPSLSSEFRRGFEQHLAAILESIGRLPPLDRTLRRIDLEQLQSLLDVYWRQWEEYDSKMAVGRLRPALFETAFGLPGEHDDAAAEASDEGAAVPALKLTTDAGTIRIAGRIDRIDMGEIGGQRYFGVIDYKSGKAPPGRPNPPFEPTRMQLELYAMAVEQLLLGGEVARPWHVGYWHVGGKGFRPYVEIHAKHGASGENVWRSRKSELIAAVAGLVRGLRSGQFPMASGDDACTSHCPYSKVCRVQHVRALEKTWTPPGSEPKVCDPKSEARESRQ